MLGVVNMRQHLVDIARVEQRPQIGQFPQ